MRPTGTSATTGGLSEALIEGWARKAVARPIESRHGSRLRVRTMRLWVRWRTTTTITPPEAKALLKSLRLPEGEALAEGPSRTLKRRLEHRVEQR